MARRQPASKSSWTDVKAELANFDRSGLLRLIQDLYAQGQSDLSSRPFWFGRRRSEALQGNAGPLALAGRIAKPGWLRRESQTGNFQLQKSCQRTGRTRGVDGLLLRMRCRVLQRRRVSG